VHVLLPRGVTSLTVLLLALGSFAPSEARSRSSWAVDPSDRQATSIGKPNAGRLHNGVLLPRTGVGYSRRTNVKERYYGTDETIALIDYLGKRLHATYPHSAPMFIGDISKKGGGRVAPHGSHRTGRDVDIAFFEKSNKERTHFNGRLSLSELDVEKSWFLIETLLLTDQVLYIFINSRLLGAFRAHAREVGWDDVDLDRFFLMPDAKNRRGLIRHASGHTYHFHVRFKCPPGAKRCQD
jgi:murein endopeptidase